MEVQQLYKFKDTVVAVEGAGTETRARAWYRVSWVSCVSRLYPLKILRRCRNRVRPDVRSVRCSARCISFATKSKLQVKANRPISRIGFGSAVSFVGDISFWACSILSGFTGTR